MNSLSYKQWNEVIRGALNKYPKMITELKLPNTVMLNFRRDESKKLTIDTFTKIVEGLGLEYEIVVKDKDGDVIDATAFDNIITEKYDKVNKKTLATIAGVTTSKTKKEVNEMPDADDIMSGGTGEVKIGDGISAASNSSDSALAASPEVAIDLQSIFGN